MPVIPAATVTDTIAFVVIWRDFDQHIVDLPERFQRELQRFLLRCADLLLLQRVHRDFDQ